jgi:hypothetical protein
MDKILTKEILDEAIAKLGPKSNIHDDLFRPVGLMGLKIHTPPVIKAPKIQISEDLKYLSDEVRDRINTNLIDLFGYKEECSIPNTSYMFVNQAIMRPEIAVMICRTTS